MEKGKGEGIILIANRVQRIEDSGTRYGVWGVGCELTIVVRGMGYGVRGTDLSGLFLIAPY